MEGPRRHVCPVDGKVYTGKPYDQVWVTKQHKRLSRLARQAAIVYALSGDRTCLDVARTIVAEYARRYRGYPLHDIHGRPGKGGKVLSQSLDDADWLVPLLQAADLIYADLTEADRRRIVEDVIRPAVNEVIRPGRLRFHNIQCRHNAAIGLGGFFAGDDDLIAEAMDGARGFEAQVRHMVNQDGQWAEGSWGYHFYALDALITLAEAARICGRDLFMSRLRPMFAAPIQAAMPNGDLPKFNDDSGVRLADRSEYEMAPSRFGDPAFAGPVRQSQRDTWRTLLYGAPYPSEGPPSARGLRLMPDSGYAILAPERGSTAWACLKYGPHGGDHGHPDKNGLVVFGGGVPIMEDPGVGAYLTGLADGWFKTTPAHNTVAADRRDQRPASGGLIAFEQFGDGSGALTDAGWAMAGVRHRRAAFMIGSETLVALDMLASLDGRAHDLDLFWHPSGRWASSPVGTPTRTEARPGYRYFAGLRSTPVRTPSPYPARAMGVWGRSVGFVTGSRTRQLTVVATAPRWELMLGTGPGAHTGERRPAAIVRQRAVSGAF
ncbi:MAG: alginate lyase family protein, partial [Armatimonadetes bacterium]|nr:alginate lyase family protein [Armatimonadota bacterium]